MRWIALQPLREVPVPGEGLDALADDLTALGWCALQFTPKVARVGICVAGNPREALVMELSASERLFGGSKQVFEHIKKQNALYVPVQYAHAATSLVALANLTGVGAGPIGGEAAIDDLPLSALAAATAHLATLARLGCTSWGDLRALPRGGVSRRFGAGLLDALDCAYGCKPEIYPWLILPEVFEAKLELQAQVETAAALMFGAQRLLKQLQIWLQLRHCGVAALELGWTMDARRNVASQGKLLLRTAQATQDIIHLQRLLAENLARITLPAPALYVSLRTVQTEQLSGASASLLLEDIQKGDNLYQMAERLGARLGVQSVLQWQARADHRPEQMQVWQPAIFEGLENTSKLIANYPVLTGTYGINGSKNLGKTSQRPKNRPSKARVHADVLYPTWLLAQPLPLAVLRNVPLYQGPLTLLAGPQRVEVGAGTPPSAPALRDYFLARSEQAGLLWIYRERLSGQSRRGRKAEVLPNWYLHGLFA